MPVRVFIPRDSSALSVGADEVVTTLQRELDKQGLSSSVDIVRNGSRGLFWLEPLLEVETPDGRIAYGPVNAEDIPALLAQGLLKGSDTPSIYLGLTEEIPYLKKQQRLTFARAGIIDPLNLNDYLATDGYIGLKNALALDAQQIVDTITESGLRGRGGAAFPTGIKWQTVLDTPAAQKYIVCNADEGDSGTFADRLQIEADPFGLIEGMTIAGLAVGASKGYIYLREEYRHAYHILNQAIAIARDARYLGENFLDSGKTFQLEIRLGAGAYVCGEETALLESIEGKRGMVRAKPPLPAIKGLFGQPTVINNVLTLSTVPIILARGAEFYQSFGAGNSRGTMPFQLAGNLRYPGLVELAFGVTLVELLYGFGGGSASGRSMRAVQTGGPLGAYLPQPQWLVSMEYDELAKLGAVLGHGGIVAFDDSIDMREQARFAMAFCAEESCGKCTPCRIGSTRGVEVIDKIATDNSTKLQQIELLEELCETMVAGSLCAMGGMTPFPVQSALKFFKDDFLK